MPIFGLVRFNLSAATTGPQYFTSELCYSEVNCTTLCTEALMSHVRSCQVERTIMPLIIVFWVVPVVACIGLLRALYVHWRAEERHKALGRSSEVVRTSPRSAPT
ncbi:viscerotropic_leishmaniasis_antigen (plasmid) [Leishmania braziliensis MHOM/BR/75/M2904]|uniref:Viscerotropic_leishmaniasis_antigen n=1 Tax=Leishmania braziliensis MHOM/BR/75/M2904 TaxID=420245 RepID=A0A3P3YXN2_LEIBR|nr:unnamed protein product [Leishmania braziliensis]CAJ2466911.1 unnamed protein product [Leishmania braziliensis]SYZ62722.1 viscerotropic_leishmaniasis_antigen [Leishmania braziliensis MHOM/BR/75/M2904]